MAKQAGLCYDARTKMMRPCGRSQTIGGGSDPRPVCCLPAACCLDCDALNAIRICAQQNLQLFFQDAGSSFPAQTPEGVQLLRQWRTFGGGPGGCSTWLPGGNNFPSTLERNGNEIPCYEITGSVNTEIPVSDGDIIPVGLVFTTNNSENCKDFAIFFLIKATDDGAGNFSFTIISSKYCINYTEIIDEATYEADCDICNGTPAPAPVCQILVSDNATGGISENIVVNLGNVAFGTSPTINYLSIIVPPCCGEILENSNLSVAQLGNFDNATINFEPPLPSGPGNWDIFIRLINSSVEGQGSTRFEITTTACGIATITFNYNVLAP